MDRSFVEAVIALFERSSLSELVYSAGDGRLHLIRSVGTAVGESAPPARSEAVSAVGAATAPAGPAATQTVLAPCAGTFYRRPGPAKEPFVSVGDRVAEGQTIAVVEAMKMLNAIEADCSGCIVRIHQEDGAPVLAGAPLFDIEPETEADV